MISLKSINLFKNLSYEILNRQAREVLPDQAK